MQAEVDTWFEVKAEKRRQQRDANAALTTILADAVQGAWIEHGINENEGDENSHWKGNTHIS